MITVLTGALFLGFAGSFHCVGMCGPIAIALPVNRTNFFTKILGIFSYNVGRLMTYMLLGAIMGLLGKSFQMAGILQWVSVVLGVIIILAVILPQVLKRFNFSSKYYLRFNSWVNQKIASRFKKTSSTSLFIIGALNGLLPCGLIFMALTSSIALGELHQSVLFMLFFGLGTIPVMFALPYFSGVISSFIKEKMRKAIPYIMVSFGLLFILRGLNLGIPYLSPQTSADKTVVQHCCH